MLCKQKTKLRYHFIIKGRNIISDFSSLNNSKERLAETADIWLVVARFSSCLNHPASTEIVPARNDKAITNTSTRVNKTCLKFIWFALFICSPKEPLICGNLQYYNQAGCWMTMFHKTPKHSCSLTYWSDQLPSHGL